MQHFNLHAKVRLLLPTGATLSWGCCRACLPWEKGMCPASHVSHSLPPHSRTAKSDPWEQPFEEGGGVVGSREVLALVGCSYEGSGSWAWIKHKADSSLWMPWWRMKESCSLGTSPVHSSLSTASVIRGPLQFFHSIHTSSGSLPDSAS